MSQYFNFKITNYKTQDANRNQKYIESEYIDLAWFHEQFKKSTSCPYCLKMMTLYIDEDSNVISDITVDRIVSKNTSHTKSNCLLCCGSCNSEKSSKLLL